MSLFPDGAGWLLSHSVGRYPRQAAILADRYTKMFEIWCAPGEARWPLLLSARHRFAELLGGILGVAPASIMLAENVTAALAAFLDALPDERLRDRVVLIAEDCFPSLHFLLAGLAAAKGFTLRTVAAAPGEAFVSDDAFVAAWDAHVALALVTWVTSTTSHRADLDRLVAHGRANGSLVCLDITQGCGVVPLDLSALAPDFAATATMKWLCGLPGAAGAYVDPRLLPELTPRLRGWFSQPDPFAWELDAFRFAPDMRRFDNGTPSCLGHAGAIDGLEWIAAQGVARIRARNLRLLARIDAAADAAGIAVLTPRAAARRGGSVMLDAGDAATAQAAVGALLAQGISCDARGARLRLSPGMTTRDDAVSMAMATIGAVLRPPR